MSDDLRRRSLLADLTRIQAMLSTGDLRILHHAAQTLERIKQNSNAEIARNPLAVALIDVALLLVAEDRERAEAREVARDAMAPRVVATPEQEARVADLIADAGGIGAQRQKAQGALDRERRTTDVQIGRPGDHCGFNPIVVDELAVRRADASDTDPRCPGCGEANPAHCHCGVVDDPVAEFADEQHRTKLSTVPAKIAAAELARRPAALWPDYESVDLDRRFDDSERLDPSDAEEPLGVHAPSGERGEGGE